MKVLVSGATGFLGYHIVKRCVAKNHEVMCFRRRASVSLFDEAIEKRIVWVETDTSQGLEDVRRFSPDVFIHAAWNGVSAEGRNNLEIQQANIEMTDLMMRLYPYKQIIMLGSQDEYGQINSVVNEDQSLFPVSEYAKAKISCSQHLQTYCESNNIEWQWIRIFSVYGEKQRPQWLIPSTIRKCIDGDLEMETTLGEQVYSYLYAWDFACAIESVIGQKGKSGIYNISSSVPVSIKELQESIKQLTGSKLQYVRTMPYRPNQSMVIMGDASRFVKTFGAFEHTTLRQGLEKVIETIRNESVKSHRKEMGQ
ncbi:MAG: NAD(P)-dependent oxidoreductase [Bacteroidales bacterium]|nr:NAD(P)-dependent oxidoreductase [Bacteroidales bacterium]